MEVAVAVAVAVRRGVPCGSVRSVGGRCSLAGTSRGRAAVGPPPPPPRAVAVGLASSGGRDGRAGLPLPTWSLGECRTESRGGVRLQVTLLAASDVEALTDLVLENFREGPDRRPRASVASFLRGRATEDPPLGVCLVARAVSGGGAEAGAGAEICGTVDIAFAAEEREPFGNGIDPPPVGSPYISNMAVGRRWRRQGVASALLAAAEAFSVDALVRGEAPGPPDLTPPNLWLHVYHNDAVATALYHSAGFVERVREPWHVAAFSLAGRGRRVLMAKPLRVPGTPAIHHL